MYDILLYSKYITKNNIVFIKMKGWLIVDVFNLVSGISSILGLIISIFVASKVIKIANSNNNNSGVILQGNEDVEVASEHSATGSATVVHNDYRNVNISGKVDKFPELLKDKYPIDNSNIVKYYDNILPRTCNKIDTGNTDILIFSTDFVHTELHEDQVQFIGYSLKSLPMKDWRSFINENYFLVFDYEKTGTINNFNMEITNFKLGKKILQMKLPIDNEINTFRLKLSDFVAQIEDWKSVDEICFVFFLNECFNMYGTLKISSMRIEKCSKNT